MCIADLSRASRLTVNIRHYPAFQHCCPPGAFKACTPPASGSSHLEANAFPLENHAASYAAADQHGFQALEKGFAVISSIITIRSSMARTHCRAQSCFLGCIPTSVLSRIRTSFGWQYHFAHAPTMDACCSDALQLPIAPLSSVTGGASGLP